MTQCMQVKDWNQKITYLGSINMGSIKNLLLHCQETMKKYDDNVNEDNLRCKHINQGWIEALIFVERNFDITEKTTERK